MSRTDRNSLGMDSTDDDDPPQVEREPRGFNMGDYATSCLNCGDHLFICNGGMCRACTRYKKRTGDDRPEELQMIFNGPCHVCGQHKRLASRHLPGHDCCRRERSFYDSSAPKVCTGCGRGERKIKTTNWLYAYDGKGGMVSLTTHLRNVTLTGSNAIAASTAFTTTAARPSDSPTSLTSNRARSAGAMKP